MWYWKLFPPNSLDEAMTQISSVAGLRTVMLVSKWGLPTNSRGKLSRWERYLAAGTAMRLARTIERAQTEGSIIDGQFAVTLRHLQLQCVPIHETLIVFCWEPNVERSWRLSRRFSEMMIRWIGANEHE